ncbi:MAG TPA: DUF4440 domain-containing protein [Candidatus Udaeobacter sp.]|nr:DUF4440 domain-containing protein [Candidatus Udaeobacter sp.]
MPCRYREGNYMQHWKDFRSLLTGRTGHSVDVRAFVLVFVFSLFIPPQLMHGDPETITQEELVRRTQELFDAVVPGNKEPWQKYFADDCIFADEKGRNLNKAQLVADISPLPKGYSGTIKVVKPKSIINGDTAILSYELDETETIFGQNLTARYHVTDTWLYRNGVWQIASSQAMRYYEDPAAGTIDPKRFADFTGTYELAPGQTRRVFSQDKNLYVERNGKREQLLPEGSEIFFRKGVEGRILFRYATNGKVDALIDRRNNEDVVWRRVD